MTFLFLFFLSSQLLFANGDLLPSSFLTSNCFGWPQTPFTPQNSATCTNRDILYGVGIDFQLRNNRTGSDDSLSTALETQPVMLEFASYTCPVAEGKINDTIRMSETYQGQVHFIVVYTIEAHPKAPDVSPYSGEESVLGYSNYSQPTTFTQRHENCQQMQSYGKLVEVLVDDLTDSNANPVWCSYGTCANSAWLIAQNGTITLSQNWFNPEQMREAINQLLGENLK